MTTTFKLFADKMGGTPATNYIGTVGEVFYDPTGATPLRISDGVTPGGTSISTGVRFSLKTFAQPAISSALGGRS